MPLVLIGAPRPKEEGMHPDNPLEPGFAPPLLSPHCHKCQLPVERFTVDYVSSPYYAGIQFECHGSTGGMKVPHEEVLYKSRNGGAIWVFTETKVSRGR